MSQQARFALALGHFEKALDRLKEVLAEPIETTIVRDALIQRFEFTFEAAWKAMYRWLRARGNDVDEEAAAVIPEAFARRLITDEKGWGQMRKFRNKTSHTYDEAIAIEVAAFVRQSSLPLFSAVLATLRERPL
jgi:nucleotidyltransferase substrate binding protein (TIGR01987 family)